MCFRGNDGKKTFTRYRDYIDAQLKVFANVRGKNVRNADSKKNLYQEIIRDANHDVQGWIKEQENKRQASS